MTVDHVTRTCQWRHKHSVRRSIFYLPIENVSFSFYCFLCLDITVWWIEIFTCHVIVRLNQTGRGVYKLSDRNLHNVVLCFFCNCQTGNGEQRSPLPTPVGDVKPAVDSAFSLPPSRGQPTSADDLLPVPVRSRDEDRSTKPRIWSLVEVATSSDYQQKRADHVVSAEFRHAAEFRPWRTTDAGSWESAAARLAARQAAVISAGNLSTTSSTRWLQNNADNSVTSSTELYRPTV